jgi:two-component system, sensor histidine kinase and response regulator
VEAVSDGRQAVERARSGDLALVLMDVQMPTMNGLEATLEMRKLPHLDGLPIVAMTAGAFADDRERCLDAGMNDHVAKPITSEALYAALAKWLPLRTTV